MSALYQQHQPLLQQALQVCRDRSAWTAFTESPSGKFHPEGAAAAGKAEFESYLQQRFAIDLPAQCGWVGAEISPYTQQPLGISYPQVEVDGLFEAARAGQRQWVNASLEQRTGVCIEMLQRCGQQLFVNAHANMHTAGQSYIMAFAGSGANALDRGLEAIVYAYKAMADVPQQASWQRQFGPQQANLHKRYKVMPRGTAVVICCATFPLWNGYPAMMANLMTGNAVIVKPHPNGILPVALAVKACRAVLAEQGFDPNLITFAADTYEQPVTKLLLSHSDTKIIDFTGSPAFGAWIEQNCPQAKVYTETAGCNSVVIESTDDLAATAKAIAHSLCQASAQMCTSVQNVHIPAEGIRHADSWASFDDVTGAIVAAVETHLQDAKVTANLCGALQTPAIMDTLARMRALGQQRGRILRESGPYAHPEFANARTATPLIIQLQASDSDIYREEIFGPVSFMIAGRDADHCLQRATTDARERGAITSHVYSTDTAFIEKAVDAYHFAGASVACNLTGMPINFAAAYSDYHVTGLNPAGTACLTDLAFVADRFRVVQYKAPIVAG